MLGFNSMNRFLDVQAAKLAKSRYLSAHAFQYCGAFCGVMCSLFFLLAFVAAGFVSPIKPWWNAEQTAHHYQTHLTGVRGGAALLVVSGMFYLPFSACISSQMRRIPNLHYAVHQLQLASAAAGIFTFILPGIILAATSYRPYRNVDITQMFNDFFWICALMPWPTFMAQNFAFSYAIILDSRPNPLFPKSLSIVNIVVPSLFTGALGIHCHKTGATAYNGAMTFWVPGATFCVQLVVDAYFLWRAIQTEPEGGEMVVDMFPNKIPNAGLAEKDLESGASNGSGSDEPIHDSAANGTTHEPAATNGKI
ncbi:MAG: hypothetical protein M1819_004555 [Sarea resinae]|nr:MAG: hypothetical protein M1819_004555 [Sarea resinae]